MPRFNRLVVCTLLALFAFGLQPTRPVLADGLIVITHGPHAQPQPHRPLRYRFAPLAVEYHHVNVTITDQVAVTEVDQVFYNPNNARLEGQYLFPIPKGAQIDKFEMDVNGKLQQAELLDATKARKIYEDIVRKMKDPALLEYADQGMFKVRIFPIEPHSKKRVRIKYTQVLQSDTGLVEYTYPLNTEKFSSDLIKSVSVKCTVQTSRPIKSIYSPSHDVEIKRKGGKHATVGFEARDVRPDTDFKLFFNSPKKKHDIGLSLLTYNVKHDDEKAGYFMLLASPGVDVDQDKIVKKDVVFVMDTSGSMAGKKLDQARKALKFVIENLNKGDRFEIVRFSTEAEPLFDQLVDVDDKARAKAHAFVDDLKPIGGTAIHEALTKAAALVNDRKGADAKRPGVVIFLTDGRPTIGPTGENEIVNAVESSTKGKSIRVFSFGIGTDINTHLLDKITEHTRAVSQYVLPEEDIEVKVSSFYNKINHPVMADVTLKITGVKTSAIYPNPMPDLFKGDQLIAFGRYEGDGDAAIILDGQVNGQATKVVFEETFAKASDDTGAAHDFIPRLWATRRVGYLLDEIRLRGESQELRDEVTRLARQYGIVTPYTAYLIVEDEARRNIPALSRSLSELGGRREALADLEKSYDDLRDRKGGAEGVANARSNQALKQARNAQELYRADAEARRGQAASKTAPARPGSLIGVAGGADAAADPFDRQSGNRYFDGAKRDRDGRVVAGKDANAATNDVPYVKGRAFYKNGKQWVDGNVQSLADKKAKRVRVQFNSDEYFALLKKHKEATEWLSQSANLQVALGGTIYEIYE